MKTFFQSIIIGLFLCLFQSILAQEILINTHHLKTEEGLLGRRVNAITQDKEGFIWIGTNEGLNRFDGYHFQHFTKENHNLISNQIMDLVVDDEGYLWIFFSEAYRLNTAIQVLDPQSYEVMTIEEKLNDSIRLEKTNLRLLGKQRDRLFIKNGTGLLRYHSTTGLEVMPDLGDSRFKTKSNVSFDDSGNFWITKGNEAIQYNLRDEISRTLTFPDTLPPWYVSQFGKNQGLILTSDKNQKVSQFLLQMDLNDNQIHFVEKNINGAIYCMNNSIWTENNIYFPFQDSLLKIHNPEILGALPSAIFTDHSNNLWVGTNNGCYILSFKKNPFSVYFKDKGGTLKLYDGRGLWANESRLFAFSPTNNFEWNISKKSKKLLMPERNIPHQIHFRSVALNTKNEIWIGGKSPHFLKIDSLSGSVLDSIPSSSINKALAIFRDKSQNWWVGDARRGLKYFQADTATNFWTYHQYHEFDALKKSQVVHFFEDKNQSDYFWIAASSGWYLAHIDKGIIARYHAQSESLHNIPADYVYYTYQDKTGIYWLATRYSGLIKVELSENFEVKNIESFTTEDGLSSNTLYAIFEDDFDNLWMSSNNGIIKFNKKTNHVRAFLLEDGLSHYEFNQGSAFQRQEGTIFFGTLNGIVSFHPNNLQDSANYNIPLKIANCQRYSEEADAMINVTQEVLDKGKIIIEPAHRFFSLFITLQDYSNSPKLRYAYKVEGFHKDFNFSESNKIFISGLPYGTYLLHIKGRGKDGRFSKKELRIPLIIVRPFYLQTWFIGLMAMFLGILIWRGILWRTRRLKVRQKELEQTVKERNKEISRQAELIEHLSQPDVQWLKTVDNLLQKEIANAKFNIHDLAAQLFLSRSQVERKMKKATGLTPNKYFRELKLQTAQKLLQSGNVETVQEVAFAVGFDTPKYFSKLFEERFGKRPIEFLK